MSTPEPLFDSSLPLSEIQKGFYFRSLQPEGDMGVVCIRAVLEGPLSVVELRQAWARTVERHECLRSSIDQSLTGELSQRIARIVEWPWSQDTPILSEAPVGSIWLESLSPTRHLLEIRCHHALVDGWSVPVVLDELVRVYRGESLAPAPSYRRFRLWLEENANTTAAEFWVSLAPSSPYPWQISGDSGLPFSCQISLPNEAELRSYARENRVTFSSILHGAWALALGALKGQDRVVLGSSASGRKAGFQGVDVLVGPLAGVLPLPLRVDPRLSLKPWLRGVHRRLSEISQFEQTPLIDIHHWWSLPPGQLLFDNLLVVQDFPSVVSGDSSLCVKEFSSDLVTRYPLTLIARPGKESWLLELICRCPELSKEDGHELLRAVQTILSHIPKAKKLSDTQQGIPRHWSPQENSNSRGDRVGESHRATRSSTEAKLLQIWDELFGCAVGLEDNFFELGGQSLVALALLTEVDRRFGKSLTIHQLMNSPTVASLAAELDKDKEADLSCLIPLQPLGTDRPIFCLHAQFGHVLHFLPLAKALGPDIPVYGIQALGIDSCQPLHRNFEEMVSYYQLEIKKLQPTGPYRLLSHCYGIPIAIELAKRILDSGEEIEMLALLDASNFLRSEEEVAESLEVWNRLRNIRKAISGLLARVLRGDLAGAFNQILSLIRIRLLKLGFNASASKHIRFETQVLNEFRTWSPPQYPGSVNIYWSSDIAVEESAVRKSWEEFALRGATFCRLRTTHGKALEEPGEFAGELKATLARVEKKTSNDSFS